MIVLVHFPGAAPRGENTSLTLEVCTWAEQIRTCWLLCVRSCVQTTCFLSTDGKFPAAFTSILPKTSVAEAIPTFDITEKNWPNLDISTITRARRFLAWIPVCVGFLPFSPPAVQKHACAGQLDSLITPMKGVCAPGSQCSVFHLQYFIVNLILTLPWIHRHTHKLFAL